MNDFSYDWINLVVYAIGQNSFVEPDKEERLQVECDKAVTRSSSHFHYNKRSMLRHNTTLGVIKGQANWSLKKQQSAFRLGCLELTHAVRYQAYALILPRNLELHNERY